VRLLPEAIATGEPGSCVKHGGKLAAYCGRGLLTVALTRAPIEKLAHSLRSEQLDGVISSWYRYDAGGRMPFKSIEARRAHHREYMRRRYQSDAMFRESIKQRNSKAAKKSHAEVRAIINDFRASGCKSCGEMAECCLSAHHVDPAQKLFNIGKGSAKRGYSAAKVSEELRKCVCLCENCHRKVHAGLLEIKPSWRNSRRTGLRTRRP
jgi:hypothetical protein